MRTVNNSLTLWSLCLLLGSSCKQGVRRSAAGRWWVSYRHTPQRWLNQAHSDGPQVQNTPPKRQGLTFNHPALSSFRCGSKIKILSRLEKHIYKKSWLYPCHFKGTVHINVNISNSRSHKGLWIDQFFNSALQTSVYIWEKADISPATFYLTQQLTLKQYRLIKSTAGKKNKYDFWSVPLRQGCQTQIHRGPK